MLARALISDSVPPIKTSDTVAVVLDWMSEFKVNQLPIVNNEELLGVVTEEELLECSDPEMAIGALQLQVPPNVPVYEDTHVFEVLKRFKVHHLDLVPVLDSKDRYIGVIGLHDVVSYLTSFVGASEPGGIIVLHVQQNDYSLSEIGRICESNSARVLSLSVTAAPGNPDLFITLKLNLQEISRVIATFERFDYKIELAVFDSEQLVDLKRNYELLMRYLNI